MDDTEDRALGTMGHNVGNFTLAVEVRLFNSLRRYSDNGSRPLMLALPAGSSVGDVLRMLKIPDEKVFLALRNGRDVTGSLYSGINTEAILDEGDVLALSGPVPYSWGYGSPIV